MSHSEWLKAFIFSCETCFKLLVKSREILFLEAARTNDVDKVSNLLNGEKSQKINVNTKNNVSIV